MSECRRTVKHRPVLGWGRHMRIFLAVALAVLLSTPAFARDLPDKTRTPGVANPDVTQDNIDQTICVSGWTKKIRPPTNYTSELKQQQIKEYRYADKKPGDYEEDHLISLQLGGHPT